MKKTGLIIGLEFWVGLVLAQNPLSIRVENLTVEQNKALQHELKDLKVVYTCIPAGLFIIHSDLKIYELKSRVNNALKKVEILVEPKYIENYSVELAEKECSAFRKID